MSESKSRGTSGRNSKSTSSKARRWCWRSWLLFISRATTPFPSAHWKRARRSRAPVASRPCWRRFDVHIQPADPGLKSNVPMLLRLNMFHLLQAVSPNSIGLDIGVPARGWTGEAYQGHIFWDELFIFPFFNYRMPEITRSLLMYRYRRLGAAPPISLCISDKVYEFASDTTRVFRLNGEAR